MRNGSISIKKKHKNHLVERALMHGARLLTRLSDEEINQLGCAVNHVDKDDLMHGAKLLTRLSDEEITELGYAVKYEMFNSSLKLVNRRLAVDLVQQIKIIAMQRRKSDDPDRTIVVLDWGAGTGRALSEIFHELKLHKILNVRLVGFGHIPFQEWQQLPEGIEMILDVDWKLPLYFGKETIDLIYSHLGLRHMSHMDGAMNEVKKIPGRNHKVTKSHPVFFLRKVSQKYRVVKRQVSLFENS